jgi:hypothetical protein
VTVKAKTRRELRSFHLVVAGAVALAVLFLVWIRLGIGGPTATRLFSNLVQAGTALVAASACFQAARRTPYGFGRAWTASLHRAWRLLGSAALAWGLGQVVWTVEELRLPDDTGVPVPSLADALWLTLYPCGYAFVVLVLRRRLRSLPLDLSALRGS